MKAADLREKSVEDLRELQKTLARDVFQNRLKNFTNRLDDTSAVRKSKRDLARIITVLKEQAMGIVRAAAAPGAGAGAAAKEEGHAEEPKAKKKAAPKAEAKSAPAAEAKPKKTAAKKASAKADKKGEAK
jgi:ribosomal protein L29